MQPTPIINTVCTVHFASIQFIYTLFSIVWQHSEPAGNHYTLLAANIRIDWENACRCAGYVAYRQDIRRSFIGLHKFQQNNFVSAAHFYDKFDIILLCTISYL